MDAEPSNRGGQADDVPVPESDSELLALATGHLDEGPTDEDVAVFYDDISGALLPTAEVRRARQEELEFLRSFPVYQKVPEEQARGKHKISVRWCDVDKGDAGARNVRSRLVGREYRWQNPFMEGTFAATPPLESLR